MSTNMFFKYDYIENGSIMKITMLDSVCDEESYIDSLSTILTTIESFNSKKILIDIRYMSFRMNNNVSRWIEKYVVPRLLLLNITKIGYLTQNKKQEINNFGINQLKINVSDIETDIIAWLKN